MCLAGLIPGTHEPGFFLPAVMISEQTLFILNHPIMSTEVAIGYSMLELSIGKQGDKFALI